MGRPPTCPSCGPCAPDSSSDGDGCDDCVVCQLPASPLGGEAPDPFDTASGFMLDLQTAGVFDYADHCFCGQDRMTGRVRMLAASVLDPIDGLCHVFYGVDAAGNVIPSRVWGAETSSSTGEDDCEEADPAEHPMFTLTVTPGGYRLFVAPSVWGRDASETQPAGSPVVWMDFHVEAPVDAAFNDICTATRYLPFDSERSWMWGCGDGDDGYDIPEGVWVEPFAAHCIGDPKRACRCTSGCTYRVTIKPERSNGPLDYPQDDFGQVPEGMESWRATKYCEDWGERTYDLTFYSEWQAGGSGSHCGWLGGDPVGTDPGLGETDGDGWPTPSGEGFPQHCYVTPEVILRNAHERVVLGVRHGTADTTVHPHKAFLGVYGLVTYYSDDWTCEDGGTFTFDSKSECDWCEWPETLTVVPVDGVCETIEDESSDLEACPCDLGQNYQCWVDLEPAGGITAARCDELAGNYVGAASTMHPDDPLRETHCLFVLSLGTSILQREVPNVCGVQQDYYSWLDLYVRREGVTTGPKAKIGLYPYSIVYRPNVGTYATSYAAEYESDDFSCDGGGTFTRTSYTGCLGCEPPETLEVPPWP